MAITALTTPEDLPTPREVYSIFELRQRRFVDEAANERATFFRDQQKLRWGELIGNLAPTDNLVTRVFGIVNSALQHDDMFIVVRDENAFVVQGKIPLLDEHRVSAAHRLLTAKKLAAAIVVECRQIFQNQQLAQIFDTELLLLVVSYSTGGLSPSEIQPYVARQKDILAALVSDLERTSNDTQTRATAFSTEARRLLNEKSDEIDALKQSVGESIRLGSSATLWRNKAIWHQIGFVFWFLIFATAACAVGWYIFNHISEIAATIPKDKDGAITYYSLVFFIVPVIAVAWLLRLLSRFINNQLVLLDDASHRDVMTKTYLALVGDKDSHVDEKDRLVMLSAIFRPLPGAQVEDIAPPTILDLLKKD